MPTNIERSLGGQINYPEDITRLRQRLPLLLNGFNDREVQTLYSDFSEDLYSAGWMKMDEDLIQSFARWLAE